MHSQYLRGEQYFYSFIHQTISSHCQAKSVRQSSIHLCIKLPTIRLYKKYKLSENTGLYIGIQNDFILTTLFNSRDAERISFHFIKVCERKKHVPGSPVVPPSLFPVHLAPEIFFESFKVLLLILKNMFSTSRG